MTAASRPDHTVAALFVQKDGVYFGVPGVDPWDEERDARLYDGPYPVVAHPPCGRWGRLAGLVQHRWNHRVGDDGGCFEAALAAVRTFGGVLEHPAYSKAWDRYDLPEPSVRHGWSLDLFGGASCYVEQGYYGLADEKPTWLYAFGVELPDLRWGSVWLARYEPGYMAKTAKGADGWSSPRPGEDSKKFGLTSATPPEFRDALIATARSAYARREVAA